MNLTNEEAKFKSTSKNTDCNIFTPINKEADTYWSSEDAPSISKYEFEHPIELIEELSRYINPDKARVITVAAFKSRREGVLDKCQHGDKLEVSLPEYVYNF